MRVTRIMLGRSQQTPVRGESGSDLRLFLFRTPVIVGSGSDERTFPGGTVMIYSSGVKRYFRPAGTSALRFDCVTFRMNHADRQYAASMDLPFDEPVELRDSLPVSAILKNMQTQSVSLGRLKEEFMELSMRQLFICICSEGESPVEELPDIPRYAQLKALRDAVYDDPMRIWSVDEVCADMRISSAYFHRIYRKAFGVTLRQDVIESRLTAAAELLETTDLSVSAVAERCGYDSDSYFMRQFRLHKGVTPTEYRRRAAEK